MNRRVQGDANSRDEAQGVDFGGVSLDDGAGEAGGGEESKGESLPLHFGISDEDVRDVVE